jgi:hypothetical protein
LVPLCFGGRNLMLFTAAVKNEKFSSADALLTP